jgi:large subunit ribosomal protein L6
MSRIGKHPVPVPSGVQVAVSGQQVTVKGKQGELGFRVIDDISVAMEDGKVAVKPRTNSRLARTMWATSRTRIANMVKGVSDGFSRNLDISGVGFRAAVQGKELVLQLGFSHEVRYPIPDGIKIVCERPTAIAISGFDKQRVGQVAAEIRRLREPEPFKGKGIKYSDEKVRRKEGKKK